MDTRIRPPRPNDGYLFAAHFSDCLFQFSLHRAPGCLTLKPDEFGSVVADRRPKLGHLITRSSGHLK
jgi:hypothetical protein